MDALFLLSLAGEAVANGQESCTIKAGARLMLAKCSADALLKAATILHIKLHGVRMIQHLVKASTSSGATLLHMLKPLLHAFPQEVSIIDVRKEISFCRKVGMNVLGVVENMSGLQLRAPQLTFTYQVCRPYFKMAITWACDHGLINCSSSWSLANR